MEEAKYPVAPILHESELAGRAYFIEKSLGDASFRTIFEEDMRGNGITAPHFRLFLMVLKKLAAAQVKNADGAWDPEEFAGGINLPVLLRELPAHNGEIKERYLQAIERLSKLPKTLLHGDCNAANMYDGGIIDLEDSFYGPFGFDLVSALISVEWSPERKDYEFHARYRFSAEQKKEFLKMLDTVGVKAGVKKMSGYVDDLAFCRAVWLCVGMSAWPKIQQWRYEKFINQYLS